jgi:predicted heme/steroid binding protein
MRQVSLEELAKHGPLSDEPWVAVNGEVFDVSSFSRFHPGGKLLLMQVAGTDASEQFNLFHHDAVIPKYRAKLKVGQLPGGVITARPVPFDQPIHFTLFHSPHYKETHYKFARRVNKFVHEEILPTMDDWALDAAPPKALYEKLGKEGFLACLTGLRDFPRQYLDPGTPEPEDFDIFHEFLLVDLLAQVANPSVMSALTNGPSIALTCVLKFGDEQQRQRLAPDCLMGRKFIALAMSEVVSIWMQLALYSIAEIWH